jgi:crotonobetainyl-CoA:carnitine CoA-transferase CaiB-like acyl-CoA transferase
MSGLSHLSGYEDGTPMKPGNFFCDQNAGVHAAFAALAALRHRRRTGEGQHIELAMIEGEFQVLGDAYIDYAMNGCERRRMGNRHADGAARRLPLRGRGRVGRHRRRRRPAVRGACGDARADLGDDDRFRTREARHANERDLRTDRALMRKRTH